MTDALSEVWGPEGLHRSDSDLVGQWKGVIDVPAHLETAKYFSAHVDATLRHPAFGRVRVTSTPYTDIDFFYSIKADHNITPNLSDDPATILPVERDPEAVVAHRPSGGESSGNDRADATYRGAALSLLH